MLVPVMTVVSLSVLESCPPYDVFLSIMQVDMTALKLMGENDLKEQGIPMLFLLPFLCCVLVFSFQYASTLRK